MTDTISFDERLSRLDALTHSAGRIRPSSLVQVLGIADNWRARIRTALNMYLWACLTQAFPAQSFPLTDDMLRDYEADVLRLPNVTPNGLVLPKRENMLAFNLLQRETADAFAALGMGADIARVQYPLNIRLQSGAENAQANARARASTKPHSDIWAGDPASGILVFLSVLGDPKHSGIRFFEPKAFPRSFVRTLEDYNEGAKLMEGAKELASFDESGWFLADPYLIHQTTKSGSGTRISLDFRFIPAQRVSSDIDEDAARKPYFISFDEWLKLGRDLLITPEEGMHDFAASARKDPYTTGYPSRFHLTPTDSTHDETLRKRAG